MHWLKAGLAALIGALLAVMGGWDLPLRILLSIMLLDIAMGTLRAIVQRRVSSDTSFRGIAKKVGALILVGLAYQVSLITGDPAIRRAVIYSFALAEGWSVIENAAAIDVFIPAEMKKIFRHGGSKKFLD